MFLTELLSAGIRYALWELSLCSVSSISAPFPSQVHLKSSFRRQTSALAKCVFLRGIPKLGFSESSENMFHLMWHSHKCFFFLNKGRK